MAGLGLLISCGDGKVVILTDLNEQRTADTETINKYLIDNGFIPSEIDTTELGVRYIIFEEGTGQQLDESDIVTFDYTGSLVNGNIFDTSVESVANSLDNFTASPRIRITYAKTGWSFSVFVTGFTDGIAKTFNKMREGGHIRFIMRSELGYASVARGSIPANSVLIFDVFPVHVRKQ